MCGTFQLTNHRLLLIHIPLHLINLPIKEINGKFHISIHYSVIEDTINYNCIMGPVRFIS